MLAKKSLIVMLAMPMLTAGKSGEYITRGEQTVLAVNAHRYLSSIKSELGNKSIVTTFCLEYQFKEMLVWDGTNGSPGLHLSCRKGLRKNRKIVIWLHGGPWASANSGVVPEQLAFMEEGYDLFIPFYPGSAERRVTFEGSTMVPDIVDALRELKGAYGWARKRYERVDVLGESFGAFLATSLAPELGPDNSIFLHNPSLGGKSRLEEIYAGQPDDELMDGVPKERARSELKRITDAYFGRLGDYSPIRLLESTKGLKLKLIYGGRDKLIIPEEIRSLTRLAVPGCGVDYRPGNGHESGKTPEQYESFRNLIRCGKV